MEVKPETMSCPETGEILKRDIRPFLVTYCGREMTVLLPGYYPDGEGNGVHIGDDLASVDEALATLKRKISGG